jgi:hypothetical protein
VSTILDYYTWPGNPDYPVHIFINAPYVSPVPTVAGIPVETFDDKQRRVWGKVIEDVKVDYHQYPKDGTTWKPTTAQLSGYDISQHKTEEQARAAHLKNNPGEDSWRVTLSVLPPGYVQPKDRVPQSEGSLSQAQQSHVKQASHTSASASHSETRQSEVKTRDEPAQEHEWGSDMVLAGRGPYTHPLESKVNWGNEETKIREPPRVLSFKSDFEDGWKD